MGHLFEPPHPGATLREDILPALGLTVTEAARQLGVTRTALSRLLNGHAGISPAMARRIEAWLGTDRGGRAEIWLGMQMDYDLWQAEQKPIPQVERAPGLAPCARKNGGQVLPFASRLTDCPMKEKNRGQVLSFAMLVPNHYLTGAEDHLGEALPEQLEIWGEHLLEASRLEKIFESEGEYRTEQQG